MASMGWMIAGMVLSAGATVGEGVMQSEAEAQAEQQQEDAMHMQEARAKTQASAQQIQRDKTQDAVLSQQKAMAAARGMSESSGSFQGSVLGGMQSYEQSSKLGNISLSMSLDNMEASIDQMRKKESAEQMGNIFDIGKSVFGAVSDVAGVEHYGSGVPNHLRSGEDWLSSRMESRYGYGNRAWDSAGRNLDEGI